MKKGHAESLIFPLMLGTLEPVTACWIASRVCLPIKMIERTLGKMIMEGTVTRSGGGKFVLSKNARRSSWSDR